MFMHFGLMHILNNMVVLGAVGQIVEKAMGHVKPVSYTHLDVYKRQQQGLVYRLLCGI